jgi:transposase-like protein
MKNQRSFSREFRQQVVDELLTGGCPAQLCREHGISSSLLYQWKRQYSRDKFNSELRGHGFKTIMAQHGNPYERRHEESVQDAQV